MLCGLDGHGLWLELFLDILPPSVGSIIRTGLSSTQMNSLVSLALRWTVFWSTECYIVVWCPTFAAVGDCWLVRIWKVVTGWPASGSLLLLSNWSVSGCVMFRSSPDRMIQSVWLGFRYIQRWIQRLLYPQVFFFSVETVLMFVNFYCSSMQAAKIHWGLVKTSVSSKRICGLDFPGRQKIFLSFMLLYPGVYGGVTVPK